MDIIAQYGYELILLAGAVGFLMAWGIGANDVANAMGTSVGSKALTMKQAILIAMVFEFAGAYLAGGEVTSTIRKGIIESTPFIEQPEVLVYGMTAALLAAGVWLAVASFLGWPVSTTHSIIGAIIGFALVTAGGDAIHWEMVMGIVGSWVITPILAGILSLGLYMSAKKLIFAKKNPIAQAKKYVPAYIGLAGLIISLVTINKGLKHIGLDIPIVQSQILAISIGFIAYFISKIIINRMQFKPKMKRSQQKEELEKIFAVLMVVTACCMAFAHGSNDVANAIGPLAAIVSIIENDGMITQKSELVWWILPLGGGGIVLGLALFGHRVIKTVGKKITHLTPSKGFAAELAAAATVVIASGTGLPVSTTQTLVGAVLGVGIAQGIKAINVDVVRTIVISWVVTLPVGAGLAIIFYYMLRFIVG